MTDARLEEISGSLNERSWRDDATLAAVVAERAELLAEVTRIRKEAALWLGMAKRLGQSEFIALRTRAEAFRHCADIVRGGE